jgi:hypothetical protein
MRTVWPLISASLVVVLCGCDPRNTSKGHVRNPRAGPLADLTVTLTVQDFKKTTVITAADGSYSVGMLYPPDVEETLTIDKVGFLGYRKQFSCSDQPHQLDVVLSDSGAAQRNRGIQRCPAGQEFSVSGLDAARLQQLAIGHALVGLHVDLNFLVRL